MKVDSFPVFPRSAVHTRTVSFLTAEFEWDRVNQPPLAVHRLRSSTYL